MKQEKKQEQETYIIPQNYSSFFSISNIVKPRNVAEAVVITIILYRVISAVPFVFELKAAITATSCIICFLVFFIGVKEESVISFLQAYFYYKITSGLRRIRIPDGKVREGSEVEGRVMESRYDKLVRKLKQGRK